MSYDYDLHGWRTELAAELDGTDVFNQILNYGSPSGQGAYARWSGAISGSLSKHYGSSSYDGENYNYDNAGRFSGTTRYGLSAHGQPSIATQERIERDVEYDSNGNILELERLLGNSEVHDLTMQYAGNRLQSVTDGNSTSIAYGYDADGNLTYDGRTGFDFSYNILNLPMSAEDGADGSTMTYTYLSDGTKLKAVSDGGAGLTYRGSFVYGLSSGGGCTLESVATDEGRIVMDGTAVKDEWHVRDHVGNVRSVVWLNAPAGTSVSASILEQNEYLPFGTRLPGSRTDQSNRYRLGGKEEQDIAGMDLGLLDFGARYYDPWSCQWTAADPLAEKYPGLSPYCYCGNDPVIYIDVNGKEWVKNDGTQITDLTKVKVYIFFTDDFRDQAMQKYDAAVKKYGDGAVALSNTGKVDEFKIDWESMDGSISDVYILAHGKNQSINFANDDSTREQITSTGTGKTNLSGVPATNLDSIHTPKGNISSATLHLNTCHSMDPDIEPHGIGVHKQGAVLHGKIIGIAFYEQFNFKKVIGSKGSFNYYPILLWEKPQQRTVLKRKKNEN